MTSSNRTVRPVTVAALVAALILGACDWGGATATPSPAPPLPKLSHVAVIVFENTSWSAALADPGFAAFTKQGVLLTSYYGITHNSLPNYLAMTSGVTPTAKTQADCPNFDCTVSGPNLAGQLDTAKVTWKGYFGGADNPCVTPQPGSPDQFVQGYVTHHNPFAYYPAVGADPNGGSAACQSHLRPLSELGDDAGRGSLPGFSFIIPDSCDDGHDRPCQDGRPGGVSTATAWLTQAVQTIKASPGWDSHSLLVVTFDESESDDTSGFGGAQGGGRVATVLVSGLVAAGGEDATPYDHYSLLRTIEDGLGLSGHLGLAAQREPISRPFTKG